MKNFQKFVTAQERAAAFLRYCEDKSCDDCELNDKRITTSSCNDHVCLAFWLDLEAEEKNHETLDEVIEDMENAVEMMRKKESEGATLFNVSVIFDTYLNRIIAAHNRVAEKCMEVKA